jgi:two-component sensor histidine kinase
MGNRTETDDRASTLRAYHLETQATTLRIGRITAMIGMVGITIFHAQDVILLGFNDLLPWRLAGFLPLLVFLILSYTLPATRRGLIIPLHTLSLAGLTSMICGITVTVMSHPDAGHFELHDAATAITVIIIAVFVFAAGARRYLGPIILLPFLAMAAALLASGKLDARGWSSFSNPAILAVVVIIQSLYGERQQYHAFRARTRAEANERIINMQHTMMSTMLDAIDESAFLMRPNGIIEYANATMAHRLGKIPADIIGKNAYALLPADVAMSRRRMIGEALASGKPVRFTDERLGRSIDNVVYPVHDHQDVISHLAIFGIDITDRLKAESEIRRLYDEKSLLLKEVHHRIKNNMSTISSLLSLGAASTQSPEAETLLSEMRDRIKAMMGIYDKLYRSDDYTHINLQSYIADLLSELSAAYRADDLIHIDARIADIQAGARLVFYLGIIVNELVTNAFKYAFPDGKQGTVRVQIEQLEHPDTVGQVGQIEHPDTVGQVGRSGQPDCGWIMIRISDDGVGMPTKASTRTAKGFGLQLVDIMVSQCHGNLSISSGDGTVFTILLPRIDDLA